MTTKHRDHVSILVECLDNPLEGFWNEIEASRIMPVYEVDALKYEEEVYERYSGK